MIRVSLQIYDGYGAWEDMYINPTRHMMCMDSSTARTMLTTMGKYDYFVASFDWTVSGDCMHMTIVITDIDAVDRYSDGIRTPGYQEYEGMSTIYMVHNHRSWEYEER